jgi:hypothetical protein
MAHVAGDAGLIGWANGVDVALAGLTATNTVATAGTAQTLPDAPTAIYHVLNLTSATCALTFPTAAAGKAFTLSLIQGTSYRAVTWPVGVQWPMDVAPVLQTAAGSVDEFTFYSAGVTWRGSLDASYSA